MKKDKRLKEIEAELAAYWKSEFPKAAEAEKAEIQEEEDEDFDFGPPCCETCKCKTADGFCTDVECRNWEEHNKDNPQKDDIMRRHLQRIVRIYNELAYGE